MTDGELGEEGFDSEDADVLLALEFGGISPEAVAEWGHNWRLRVQGVLSAKRRALKKRQEQNQQ